MSRRTVEREEAEQENRKFNDDVQAFADKYGLPRQARLELLRLFHRCAELPYARYLTPVPKQSRAVVESAVRNYEVRVEGRETENPTVKPMSDRKLARLVYRDLYDKDPRADKDLDNIRATLRRCRDRIRTLSLVYRRTGKLWKV